MPTTTVPPVSENLELSLEELGIAANVHWSMCGMIERGQRNPSLHVLLRVAAGLQIDLGQLVENLPAAPPPTPRKRKRSAAR